MATVIPILYHTGGDGYFSAMERVWYFIAHYAAQDRWKEHEDRFLERQLEIAREIQPVFGSRPVATGGALAGRKRLGRSMRIELSPKRQEET